MLTVLLFLFLFFLNINIYLFKVIFEVALSEFSNLLYLLARLLISAMF